MRYLGEHTLGYLLTNRIGKEIISQSNFPNEVYFVSPDTLFFEFAKQTGKRGVDKVNDDAIRLKVKGRDTVLHRNDTLLKHYNAH
jgi:hypothetical protein